VMDIYFKNLDSIGKNVIMVGGGLVGSEAALHLAARGRQVTVVEMLAKVAPDCYPLHREALIHEMDKALKYRTGLKVTSIGKNGVKTVDAEGKEEFLAADTVVYALGMKANRKQTESLAEAAKAANIPVQEIGDCVRASKVFEAVQEGYLTAMAIL